MVFTTAASDAGNGLEAVRSGALIIWSNLLAYERLGQTLTRYQQRRRMLAQAMTAPVKSRLMKCLTPARAASEGGCRSADRIDALTLNAVLQVFADPTVHHTAETIACALTISQNDLRRYLEHCQPPFDYRGDYSREGG